MTASQPSLVNDENDFVRQRVSPVSRSSPLVILAVLAVSTAGQRSPFS